MTPKFVKMWPEQPVSCVFQNHWATAVDSSGNVYVADQDRILKLTADGVLIAKWGSKGRGEGQFRGGLHVAVDAQGNVYVADSQNCRIQKFTADGKFIATWGSQGGGEGEFRSPGDIGAGRGRQRLCG